MADAPASRTVTALTMALAIATAALAAEPDVWATCARNAEQANEAFTRCNRMVHAWYKHKGTANMLVPQNLRSRQWNGHNAAADLWSFFVLTAHLTDQKVLGAMVRQTLRDDIALTTRVGWLTADFDIDKNAFVRKEPDVNRLIFSNSEYVKDGLLPICELMGQTVWFDRARGLIEDICTRAPVETKFGNIPSESAELNGEMLQNLCRFYCATRDERYKQWAFRIADAYFLDALPKCNDLPCHSWDFANGKPRSDRLSLSDHGNEIVFGLSEAMVLAHVYDEERAPKYIAAMKRMVDKLLAIAVNEHGLFMHSIQPSTGKVLRRNVPDTWGYSLDGVYALHMVTGEAKYRDAVARALKGINADPRYRNWGGADAFADSIESGIVLLNRIPEPEGFEWLEATVKPFLAKQRADGIIEGWHGDGNYARTALMYALMKTAGTRVEPWRPDLKFGAVVRDGKLYVQLTADRPWEGKLFFDYPRHRYHFGLTLNYPRLNEYPEWYAIDPDRSYLVTTVGGRALRKGGHMLLRGLYVSLADKPTQLIIERVATMADQYRPGTPPDPRALVTELTPIQAAQVPGGILARPGGPKIEPAVAGAKLSLRVVCAKPWSGILLFDYPNCHMELGRRPGSPKERAAASPYHVDPVRLYQVAVNGKALAPMLGDDLIRGLPAHGPSTIVVEPRPGPPYGGKAILIEAPPAVGGDGTVRIPITVSNETGRAAEVVLKTDFGKIEPAKLSLPVGKSAEATLTCEIAKAGEATITATMAGGQPVGSQTIRLVHGKNLVGFKAFDDQEYNGVPYLWCGRKPIAFSLPARPGKPQTLHLLWGSKGGERKAKVTINGKAQTVSQGGYDGFKWLTIAIEPERVKRDTVTVRIEKLAEAGAAFISQAKLTSP